MQWPTGNSSHCCFILYLCLNNSLSEAILGIVPGTGFGIHVDGGAPLIGSPAAASTVGALDLPSQSVPGQFLDAGASVLKDAPAVLELPSYFGHPARLAKKSSVYAYKKSRLIAVDRSY